MHLGENPVEMRIPRPAYCLYDPRFRIPKPLLIEFITASKKFGCRVRSEVRMLPAHHRK
jgi:hypothetical protein